MKNQAGTATPSSLRAVICDFDGTLADSYQAITASVNFVRAEYQLAPLAEPEVRGHVGRGLMHLLQQLVPVGDLTEAAARYRQHHATVLQSGTRLLPGVAETLTALNQAGLQLAVCSNKPGRFTRQLLDLLGLAALFTVVVGPEDAPQLKPAPDLLWTALARLGVSAAQALYVGDMVLDIETARSAGVPVWVLPTGSDDRNRLLAAGPDRLLERFEELTVVLNRAG